MNVWEDIDTIVNIIKNSKTRKEVLEKIGRSPTTTMYRRLKRFEQEHEVDVSHFTPYHTSAQTRRSNNHRTLDNETIFCKDSKITASVVKRRLKTDKLIPYICRKCGNDGTWFEEKLVLQLEHIDGDSTNNELTNLCFLCPNCHSQTTTFCGRNVEYKNNRVSKRDYIQQVKQAAQQKNQPLVDLVLQSNIDFSKFGWSKQVASLIGKKPQKVKDWMMRYMKDFYETRCFHHRKKER